MRPHTPRPPAHSSLAPAVQLSSALTICPTGPAAAWLRSTSSRDTLKEPQRRQVRGQISPTAKCARARVGGLSNTLSKVFSQERTRSLHVTLERGQPRSWHGKGPPSPHDACSAAASASRPAESAASEAASAFSLPASASSRASWARSLVASGGAAVESLWFRELAASPLARTAATSSLRASDSSSTAAWSSAEAAPPKPGSMSSMSGSGMPPRR
mmetsp:Transcript_22467/g.71854  ORF Transcript_22467/g.71854 Transcript_22467/m.71854 type:complete len:215 (+) Transcript_22467:360-1004(+)